MKFFREISILMVLFFFLNSFTVYGLERNLKEKEIQNKADQYLQKLTEEKRFSGAILIAKEGKIILNKGYGIANHELDVKNTPKTKFQIGSITKQFTSMAIMQLAEKGLLNIKDPISKYIPQYPEGEKITIHHLLTHSSGIWDYTHDLNFFTKAAGRFSPEEIILMFKDKPLLFAPGEKSEYSNSNYVLLGFIIEKLSDMTYEEYVSKNILNKIKMHDSGYGNNKRIIQNRASGYIINMDQLENAPFMNSSYVYASGDMYSTVEDLYLWDQALYTTKLLSKEYLDKMFTPNQNGYGYGWKIHDKKYIYHDGIYSGFSSQISRFIEDKATIIVLSNCFNTPVNEISRDLSYIIFGKGFPKIKKREVRIKPDLCQEYAGEYRFPIGSIEVIENCGNLYIKPKEYDLAFEILPKDEQSFIIEGIGIKVVFVRTENGKISELISYINGKKLVGKKNN